MSVDIRVGDCRDVLKTLPDQSVNCIVTSPPYFGLRDYGVAEQIGLEQTPEAFVAELVAVFAEARRVLRDDGTMWLNLGDSYASIGGGYNDEGSRGKASVISPKTQRAVLKGRNRNGYSGLKAKDLIGIPWRVAFALQADGWYLRQDIIWSKPNPMPESVTDRCTKAHEYVFLLSKSPRYLFDAAAIAEDSVYGSKGAEFDAGRKSVDRGGFNGKTNDLPGREAFRAITETRNKRSVWTIATQPFAEAHFATMAPELAKTCIMAGCPLGGIVLDPFGGAGTTGLVADRLGRNSILIELNPEYATIARERIADDAGMFGEVA